MKPVENKQDGATPGSLRDRVEHVLALIRPSVVADGGDVELVDVTADGEVSVRFLGACVGCPSSHLTLQAGIERNLIEHVPGIRTVKQVT
jgi:Fe-S cluster biogenesis protein NfuA